MTLRAILFDHDGTLVDSEATHLKLWREVVAPYGVEISDTLYWQRMLGVPMAQNAVDIIETYRLDVSVDTLVQAKQEANVRFLRDACFPQMSGADQVLRDLATRLRLALVSGSQRDCVDASLRGHGWRDLFEHTITGDDVPRNKPHPDGYLKALELMQLAPEQCIAVEDTEVGVRAAVAAGLRVVAIRSPLAINHDFGAAERVVSDLTEAYAWLKPHI